MPYPLAYSIWIILLWPQLGLAYPNEFTREQSLRPKVNPALVRLPIHLAGPKNPPLKHHLMASLAEPSHFFVRGLHIETHPLSFDPSSRHYATELRLSRIYQDRLEEVLGTTKIEGQLTPPKEPHGPWTFQGQVPSQRLANHYGAEVLTVTVGMP